eukprot:UN06128
MSKSAFVRSPPPKTSSKSNFVSRLWPEEEDNEWDDESTDEEHTDNNDENDDDDSSISYGEGIGHHFGEVEGDNKKYELFDLCFGEVSLNTTKSSKSKDPGKKNQKKQIINR